MAEVTRYIVVPGSFDLPDPNFGSHIEIPGVTTPGISALTPAVLFLKTEHTEEPNLRVFIDGTNILSHEMQAPTGSVPVITSFVEVFDSRLLVDGPHVLIVANEGTGQARFGDIVIMYTAETDGDGGGDPTDPVKA